MIKMTITFIFFSLFYLINSSFLSLSAQEPQQSNIKQLSTKYIVQSTLRLSINSSINPATLNYLEEGFNLAQKENHQLIIIELNTPGGMVSTTKEILTLFGKSDIPVIIWVTPQGASATSAGAIIASGSHYLFMSEGTNIGAATPVQMGNDIPKDLRNKAINDLVALVQSLSDARDRNGKLFGDMIEKASSFKSSEAVEKNLVNGIANSTKEIFQNIDQTTISIKGIKKQLTIANQQIKNFDMDLGQKLLNIFADPNLTYILFLIGAALIYLELQAPGGFIAGSLGAVCLLLAGIGFQVIPLNMGALGLIVLSFLLFIIEIYITSYGILTLAGLASLISGSLFLYRTDEAYIELSKTVIFSSIGAVVTFLIFIAYFFVKGSKKTNSNFNDLIGEDALIVSEIEKYDEHFIYQIKVHGELWKAESNSSKEIGKHYKIINQNKNNLTLII